MIEELLSRKKDGQKVVMVTAYDYPFAKIVDEAGVDIVLVGDSLANVVLGLDSTRDVDVPAMIHHAKAVRRGVSRALLVGDMPYCAFQNGPEDALKHALRFVDEAGCDAVKVEWFEGCIATVEKIINAGIPVMGHVGLTPQTAEELGGFKVQGKDADSARNIIANAKAFKDTGCFSLVIECVPSPIAAKITREMDILTIGIGAGPECDAQVLVMHDLLGLFDKYRPKFVKQYIDLSSQAKGALEEYCREVRDGVFPSEEHSFKMNSDEMDKLS